ncbi:solute carrier organic anion transporter family member 5A1-like [Patiria miniata]|uniref:Solute carrier organic anion transporter family member n=1 Tax=Patiria miniata TaxID=46514 RepID=A0A913ZN10_PATMI|nr:solute carrier organic anion transporter family member 5A1-like [Patiria miniata]
MGCSFFHRPPVFGFCIMLFVVFQTTVALYIAGILTTLEKQYRITTSVGGLVLSTSDFASLLSIIGLTYLGNKWHKPRMLGVLGIMTGLGGILSGIPHFMYPAYREDDAVPIGGNITSSNIFVCDAGREEEKCSAEDIGESGSRIHEMWALLLGQAIMGFAYGPIFPIALTYIDDQVKGTTTPYYLALLLTGGSTATLVGYGQAFLFLPLNVNWPAEPDYTKEWIGAWWMGFILDGIIIMLVSIPFFFFPKEMDVEIDEKDIPKEKLAVMRRKGQDEKLGVKDFLQVSKRVGTNFIFMIILVGNIFDLAVAASFGFFMAKFLEVQYNIPAANSSLFVGIIIMPGALLGNIGGGLIVKKLKLTSKGCGQFVVVFNIIVMACIPGVYFLSCPVPSYSGFADGKISTTNPCNEDCTCSDGRYEPVCGYDGLVYATPCFAGCTGQQENQTSDPNTNITVYTGCACSAANATDDFSRQAMEGKCLEPCNMIYFACIFLFCIVFFGTVNKNPLVIMTLRCVENDKTYALGVQSFFGRALGFLPAPLYFGAAIEGACILDRIECGVAGDCLIYDAALFRLTFLGIFFGLKVLTLACYATVTVKVITNGREEGEQDKYEEELKNGALQSGLEGAYNKGYDGEYKLGTKTDLTEL